MPSECFDLERLYKVVSCCTRSASDCNGCPYDDKEYDNGMCYDIWKREVKSLLERFLEAKIDRVTFKDGLCYPISAAVDSNEKKEKQKGEGTIVPRKESGFQALDICGVDCLWIDDDRVVIPESGFPCTITMPNGEKVECSDGYLYWLRGRDDDPEVIGSIESKKCIVNNLGRVIAKDPFIDVDADGYLDLDEEDVDYTGIITSIGSFMKWW